MFHFLISKKGFTLMEIMIVVIILGILLAIAVPVYSGALYMQRKNDCRNNRKTIESVLGEAMLGMMDNGTPQKNVNGEFYINFDHSDPEHVITIEYNGETVNCLKLVPEGIGEDNLVFTLGDVRCGYYSKEMAIKEYDEIISLEEWKTSYFGDSFISYVKYRVDRRDLDGYDKYKMGCKRTKRCFEYDDSGEVMLDEKGNEKIYEESIGYYLKKEDLKDVPFYTYFDNQEIPVCAFSTDEEPYFYYVLGDGSVICTCSHCQ